MNNIGRIEFYDPDDHSEEISYEERMEREYEKADYLMDQIKDREWENYGND